MATGEVLSAAMGLRLSMVVVTPELLSTYAYDWYSNCNDKNHLPDDEASALRFADASGTVVAAMLNFNCHETIVGLLNRHPVSYTHLTLPTIRQLCRSRWSPYH